MAEQRFRAVFPPTLPASHNLYIIILLFLHDYGILAVLCRSREIFHKYFELAFLLPRLILYLKMDRFFHNAPLEINYDVWISSRKSWRAIFFLSNASYPFVLFVLWPLGYKFLSPPSWFSSLAFRLPHCCLGSGWTSVLYYEPHIYPGITHAEWLLW